MKLWTLYPTSRIRQNPFGEVTIFGVVEISLIEDSDRGSVDFEVLPETPLNGVIHLPGSDIVIPYDIPGDRNWASPKPSADGIDIHLSYDTRFLHAKSTYGIIESESIIASGLLIDAKLCHHPVMLLSPEELVFNQRYAWTDMNIRCPILIGDKPIYDYKLGNAEGEYLQYWMVNRERLSDRMMKVILKRVDGAYHPTLIVFDNGYTTIDFERVLQYLKTVSDEGMHLTEGADLVPDPNHPEWVCKLVM